MVHKGGLNEVEADEGSEEEDDFDDKPGEDMAVVGLIE